MPTSHLLTTAAGNRVRLHSAVNGGVEWHSADIDASSPTVILEAGLADLVFVGSSDGWIYQFSLSSGAQIAKLPLWNPLPQDWVRGLAYADGVVYATAGDRLYAHQVGSGPLWKHDMDNLAWGDPVVANGIVYAGSWDGKLYAINVNGTPAWIATDLNYFAAEPVVYNGVVYADAGAVIVALDAATGGTLWQTTPNNQANISSPVAVGGGRVYASTAWGALVCAFDAATGAELWTSSAGGHPTPPMHWGGRVFAATEHGGGNGYVRAFDAADGHVIWQSTVPVGSSGDAVSRPVVDMGPVTPNVFVTSQDGHAYAFDGNTGALVWKSAIGGGWPVNPTWTDQAVVAPEGPWDDFVAVDPLSLVLRSDIYVKINLPYPAPVERAAVRLRKAEGGMSDRQRREALKQLSHLTNIGQVLTGAIESLPRSAPTAQPPGGRT
jgi:outer membrane protein assembly factor BamB